MSTGNHDLRTFISTLYFDDISFHTVMCLIVFAGDLLISSQHSFNFAQIDVNISVFNTLYHTGNDVLGTALETFIYLSTLCFTDTLHNNLFCILGSDTAKIFRSNLCFHNIAHFVTTINSLSLCQRHIIAFLRFAFYNGTLSIHMDFTGYFIHIHSNILIRTKIFFISSNQSFFNSLEQELRVNSFFLSQFLNC